MFKYGVSGRWFTETDVKHFKSDELRTIISALRTIHLYAKLKKRIISQVYIISVYHQCMFIDTEQLSKMWISSQVFFKDFVDIIGTT